VVVFVFQNAAKQQTSKRRDEPEMRLVTKKNAVWNPMDEEKQMPWKWQPSHFFARGLKVSVCAARKSGN
jgi:hypothetical protein